MGCAVVGKQSTMGCYDAPKGRSQDLYSYNFLFPHIGLRFTRCRLSTYGIRVCDENIPYMKYQQSQLLFVVLKRWLPFQPVRISALHCFVCFCTNLAHYYLEISFYTVDTALWALWLVKMGRENFITLVKNMFVLQAFSTYNSFQCILPKGAVIFC